MKRSDFIPDDKLNELLYFAAELPEQFRTLGEQAHEAFKEELAECESRADSIKAEHEYDINTSTDDNGKKIFSNQTQRTAELTRRLAADEQYQSLLRDVDRYKAERNRLWKQKDECEMRFKSVLARLSLATALTYSENLIKEHENVERTRHIQTEIAS